MSASNRTLHRAFVERLLLATARNASESDTISRFRIVERARAHEVAIRVAHSPARSDGTVVGKALVTHALPLVPNKHLEAACQRFVAFDAANTSFTFGTFGGFGAELFALRRRHRAGALKAESFAHGLSTDLRFARLGQALFEVLKGLLRVGSLCVQALQLNGEVLKRFGLSGEYIDTLLAFSSRLGGVLSVAIDGVSLLLQVSEDLALTLQHALECVLVSGKGLAHLVQSLDNGTDLVDLLAELFVLLLQEGLVSLKLSSLGHEHLSLGHVVIGQATQLLHVLALGRNELDSVVKNLLCEVLVDVRGHRHGQHKSGAENLHLQQ